ncbi:hypothetical protein BIW11_02911 [Tropilaelaps mercedesae]|uniref:Uncharacterized protein n=1 Tax=Tropilaelaps mercedesae TaxID=418985 RepID=A0A1V9XV74_9ACAR|nr:hypothetical protein BIW11_02911 [Tropilaelaps mercedesae]
MRQFLHTPENFVSWRELDCKHRQQQAVAKGYFDKARKMGGKLAADQLYATISTRIDSAYEVFKRENQRAEYLKELREEQRREKERQLHTETMRMKSMRANDILLNQMEWYSNELRKQIVRLETEVNGLRKRTNVSREEQDGGSCILL